MQVSVSRKSFIAGAALLGGALCAATPSFADAAEPQWTAEADVVVVGLGAPATLRP